MDLESLTAAVELHRTRLLDKYGRETDDPDKAAHRRCTECQMSVPASGCLTWRTAHPSEES